MFYRGFRADTLAGSVLRVFFCFLSEEAGIVVGRSGQFCQESESFKSCRSLGVDKTLAINKLELSNSLLEEMTAIEE